MKEHMATELPTMDDTIAAVWGTWDRSKRQPGLIERVNRIEILLAVSLPIMTAKALGVPTDHVFELLKKAGSLLGVLHSF